MNPENFKTDQLVFKPIKTLGKDDDTCRFMPIKIKCDDNEKNLLFVTEKLFSFGAQKPAKYKSYSLPLCLWDEKKDTEDTISKKKELLQAFQGIEKECKKNLKKEKIKYTMENKSILSCLYNSNKELAPVLYATIDQDKKGKLLASLYENTGKTNKIITNCKHLMDSRWKVKAVLKVTGVTLTEKYTSLKIKLVEGLFRAYNSQSVATHILGQETLSDSEDSEDPEDDDDVESLN